MNMSPLYLLLLLCCLFSGEAYAMEIRHVQHDSNQLQQPGKDNVTIGFDLSESAHVTLSIFDAREWLIREINSEAALAPSRHTMIWNGKDNAGRDVPPGVYHYTLKATNSKDQTVEYDLTDLTGGDDLTAKNVIWDSQTETIQYVLDKPGRVNIRIGLQDQGPLLRTLLEWPPRKAGMHQEKWDGMDASGVLNLSSHPKREILVQAFSLSKNTILVGEPNAKEQFLKEFKWNKVKREKKQTKKKRMHTHSQQAHVTRGDFKITLKLPQDITKTHKGMPVVSGKIPVKLDINENDRLRATNRRFEAGFYIDGIFVYENETAFLPMTWYWDTAKMNKGVHYLTANLRGYEGNFGMQTLKVYVEPIKGKSKADNK